MPKEPRLPRVYSAFHGTCRLGAETECAATFAFAPHWRSPWNFDLRYLLNGCTNPLNPFVLWFTTDTEAIWPRTFAA